MGKNRKENELLTQTITKIIEQQKPKSVRQLVDLVRKETPAPETEIIEHIVQLRNRGKIKLEQLPEPTATQFTWYLRKHEAYWYWITLALAATTAVSVLTIAEDSYPLVYIRYVLGLIFILFLPGYGLTKALFPKHTPFQTQSKSLDSTIRIALSIGLSLAIVPIITLLLDYTPLGVRLTPILLSLLAITLASATIGLARGHRISRA